METVIKCHNRGNGKSDTIAPPRNDKTDNDNDDKTPTSGSQRQTPSGSAALPLSARRFGSVVSVCCGGCWIAPRSGALVIYPAPAKVPKLLLSCILGVDMLKSLYDK